MLEALETKLKNAETVLQKAQADFNMAQGAIVAIKELIKEVTEPKTEVPCGKEPLEGEVMPVGGE